MDSLIVSAPRGMGKSVFINSPFCERITGVSAPDQEFQFFRPKGPFILHWAMWEFSAVRPNWKLDKFLPVLDQVESLVILGTDYSSYQGFILRECDRKYPLLSRFQLNELYQRWLVYFVKLGLTPIYVLTRFEKRKQDRCYLTTTRKRFFETVVGSIKVL